MKYILKSCTYGHEEYNEKSLYCFDNENEAEEVFQQVESLIFYLGKRAEEFIIKYAPDDTVFDKCRLVRKYLKALDIHIYIDYTGVSFKIEAIEDYSKSRTFHTNLCKH